MSTITCGLELATRIDGETIFSVSVPLGCEGIVSKRLGSPYRSGRSNYRVKVKKPKAPTDARLRRTGGDCERDYLRRNRPVEVERSVHGCSAERRARSTCASYPGGARYDPPIPVTDIEIRSRMFEMRRTIELVCGRHAWPSSPLRRLSMAAPP